MESSWRGRSSGRSCSRAWAVSSRRRLGRSRWEALQWWRSARSSALRAVWKWERTRGVVTTEKVFVVGGTWRKRARAVRLAAVEAVELEQTFPGQLLGYGTVVVGSLALDDVPKPKSVYRLLERLDP